jgi:hypothetical protein
MTEEEWRENPSWRELWRVRPTSKDVGNRTCWFSWYRPTRLWLAACMRWGMDDDQITHLLPEIECIERIADGLSPDHDLDTIASISCIFGDPERQPHDWWIPWQKGDLLHYACRLDGDPSSKIGVVLDQLVEYLKVPAAAYLRDIFGNPFRPVAFAPEWRTDTAVTLARTMYEAREFSAMPILADALQDAGCDSDDVLNHCRDAQQVHVRGCWVVDLVLGKA